MNATILLTGATGNTGQVVAEELQRRGLPFVAMVRSQANQAKLAAKGIATVIGDKAYKISINGSYAKLSFAPCCIYFFL